MVTLIGSILATYCCASSVRIDVELAVRVESTLPHPASTPVRRALPRGEARCSAGYAARATPARRSICVAAAGG